MLAEAVLGGMVSAGGMILLYQRLPEKIKTFCAEHEWTIHSTVAYVTWVMHEGTFIGTLAAGFSALFTAAYLRIQKNPESARVWAEFVEAFREALRILAKALVAAAKGFTTLVKSLEAKADAPVGNIHQA